MVMPPRSQGRGVSSRCATLSICKAAFALYAAMWHVVQLGLSPNPSLPEKTGIIECSFQGNSFMHEMMAVLQEPEAWQILKDLEKISDEYDSRCGLVMPLP